MSYVVQQFNGGELVVAQLSKHSTLEAAVRAVRARKTKLPSGSNLVEFAPARSDGLPITDTEMWAAQTAADRPGR